MASLHLPSPFLTFTFTFLFFFTPLTESTLTYDYYKTTCPSFNKIIQETVTDKQIISPSTAAGTLRLFFHDCIHNGCDASILISSTAFNTAERDADINKSLPGDGFDVVVRAKTALELACPNSVSCADILAATTRDLVVMVGGPYYNVPLGRRDGRVSKADSVEGSRSLPRPTMSMSELIDIFGSRNFSVQEMVALSGAHTIGFSHCKEFNQLVLRNDSRYSRNFVQALRSACADYPNNPTLSVFNDIMTPNKFDNLYYQNLPRGLGLLQSDHALNVDPRTSPFVQLYGNDQDKFFIDFAKAMEKLSVYGVQTGWEGEIRHKCDAIN